MNNFSSLLKDIKDLEVVINCLLVNEGIRKSFLIQQIDLKYRNKIKYKNTLKNYKKKFNNFKFVSIDQGILVLKKDTTYSI